MEENIKKSKIKQFFKFFRNFDNFGVQIDFRIGKNSHYTSIFGGILFFIFFFISLIYVMYSFSDFINRNIFSINFSSKLISPAPRIESVKEFSFGFSLNYLNYSVVSLDILNMFDVYVLYRNRTGLEFTDTKFTLEHCKLENFQTQLKEFLMIGFERAYCLPDTALGRDIQGNDVDFNKLHYEIRLAIKQEYIKDVKKLLEIPLLSFLVIREGNVDYEKYENSITYGYNLYSSIVDFRFEKVSKIRFSNFLFSTDNNILFQRNKSEYGLLVESWIQDIYFIDDREKFSNYLLHSFQLGASSKLIIYERTYQKLPDFLANMTGLISQIAFILFIVVNYVNEKGANQKIMTKLMKYKGNPNFDVDLLINLFSNKINKNSQSMNNSNFKSKRENISNVVSNKFPIVNKSKSIEVFSLRSTNEIKLQKRGFIINKNVDSGVKSPHHYTIKQKKLNSLQILFSFCGCCPELRNRVKSIEKGGDKVNFYLDVITYIKRMQEIDLIKYLLFSQDQLNLLDFLSKPSILPNIAKNSISREFEQDQKYDKRILKENIESILISYENIVNKENYQENTKLINLFESEIENFIN